MSNSIQNFLVSPAIILPVGKPVPILSLFVESSQHIGIQSKPLVNSRYPPVSPTVPSLV